MRVLVADDNEEARKILERTLLSLHFRVKTVASGGDAIEAVRNAEESDPFGLMLMDWRMPGIDGIEATRRILAGVKAARPPVAIMLSASEGAEGERQNALNAGAADFLLKPLTPSSLLDAILKVFAPDIRPALRESMPGNDQAGMLSGARILLVEDNEINQEIAVELLQAAGAGVEIANNGKESIARLMDHAARIDLVLMDVQMPEMDGYEATRRIRAAEWGTSIPVIAMTAHALSEEREKALEAGMNDHISKPIDPDAMVQTIRKYYRGPTLKGQIPEETPHVGEKFSLAPIVGVDVVAGLKRVAGNASLYAVLLRRFAEGHHETPARIAEALEKGDRPTAEHLAHTVKGIAGNLGVVEVQELSGELERRIQTKDTPTAVEENLRRLAAALQKATAGILETLPSRAPVQRAGSQLDAAERTIIIARLTTLIKESDSDALDYLESVSGRLASSYAENKVELLREKLIAYDFSAAWDALQRLDNGIV